MRYLVTGGAGFIGSHLVHHLVAAGHDVVVLDDLSTGRRENLTPVADRLRLLVGSVTDAEMCRRAMEGVDCVLHHAAVTSVERSVREPLAAHAVNATGTVNVLLAAGDAGVRRVVFAGSTSAYGNPADLPNHEDDRTHPLSPYAASKLAAEQYCEAFQATYGLEPVVLRYFNIFGPRQDPKSQYAAVIPRFITAALRGESPTIYGDGGQTRDFVYVANVVHANMLASRAPAAQVAGHAVEHLAQLIQAERLAQHRPLRPQQVVARLCRDRVARREDDAALAAPPFDPQLLKQVEAAVRFVEVHVHDQRVVGRGRLGELPPRVVVPRHAGDLVAQPFREQHHAAPHALLVFDHEHP